MNDWTQGAPAIVFQHCRGCRNIWYFARRFCPRCATGAPESRHATGRGRIYAITTVARAPSAELRALAPYRIALVDMEEGFRVMAHAAADVALDDLVQTRFVPFGALSVPYCEVRDQGA